MFRLVAREQIIGETGKFYLIDSLKNERGKTRRELQDDDLVVPLGSGSLSRSRQLPAWHPRTNSKASDQ